MRAPRERSEQDDPSPVGVARAPEQPPDALLRLQRGAGNAAVTRMIQRMVGLEYQTSVKLSSSEGLTEGATLASADGWHVVADEVKGNTGELEFVTDPFESSDELEAAAAGAQQAALAIEVDSVSTFRDTSPLSDIVPGAPDEVEYEHSADEVSAAPQATWDVPLARITELMKMMDEPLLGRQYGGAPEDERTWSLAGGEPDDAEALANCADLVEDWFDTNVDEPQRYQRLMGLSALALSYIVSGASQKATQPYAKLIAPLLSRTSFSSMWQQLSKLEKELFDPGNAGGGQGGKATNFSDWLSDLAYEYASTYGTEDPGTALYPHGFKSESTDKKVRGPDILDWLFSIVAPGPGGRDMLSPPAQGSQSMGRFKARGPAAMVELRRLPKNLPATSWSPFAVHVFGLYLQLFAAELEETYADRLAARTGGQFGSNPFAVLAPG
ncbi:MAG: hypothetical protein HOQ03_01340 [Thermoleophilia bacterium]|nr:hypothetical protein [Thermoleophilia bacterium]